MHSLEEFSALKLDEMRGYLQVHHPALLKNRRRAPKRALVDAYATVLTAVGLPAPDDLYSKLSAVLEKNSARCLDDEHDRLAVLIQLMEALRD